VHPDLKTVIELQRVDLNVAELKSQIDDLPHQIEALEKQLEQFGQVHEERKHRLASNQKERRELEGEIQAIQAKVSKHKDQLYEVKTNEQYRAMMKEIQGEEANVRKIEDRILDRMVEAEELQKGIQEAAAQLAAEKARVSAEKARLESRRRVAIEQRDCLLEQRKALADTLSEGVREQYERLRNARNGIAVAEVRDGSCSACNVRLRPQVYYEIRTNDVIHTCENCVRILYYIEPPAAEETRPEDKDARAAV
jgi:predicted  nucleic acid-binding Zn-ribbon protein